MSTHAVEHIAENRRITIKSFIFLKVWQKLPNHALHVNHALVAFKPCFAATQPYAIKLKLLSWARTLCSTSLKPNTHSQRCCKFAPIWLHLNTFLSKSWSSHFRAQIHLPEAIASLLSHNFIWTPFRQDVDQAIFKPKYTFPNPLQICSHMASFGHLFVQILIKPFSNPDTPNLDTFPSRSGSSHFRTQIHLSKTVADLLPCGFNWTLFCPDINQAIFKPKYTFPNPSQMKNHPNHMLLAIDALAITKLLFVVAKPHAQVHVFIVCL